MMIVAEIGSAHKGSKEIAYRMIYEAARAGATHAKFQLGWPNPIEIREGNKIDAVRYAPMEWVEFLWNACDVYDIFFLASVWSVDAVRLVENDFYVKIAHQKNEDDELINAVLNRREYPGFTIVSGKTTTKDYLGVYVTPGYPSYMFGIPDRFSVTDGDYWGYSSHAFGYEDAIQAVQHGAAYIEKHLTLNPADLEIRDHAFALTPSDFAEMVQEIKSCEY